MRLHENIDFTTLTWVKPELDETLRQARQALEAYVEEGEDPGQLKACATLLHQVQGVAISDENEQFRAAVAAPILCGGDVLGAVLFLSPDGKPAGETECKLAQTVASFLGKHMES